MSSTPSNGCSPAGQLSKIFKTLLLTVFTVYSTNVFAQSIDMCDDFVDGPNANWPYVLVATTVADGAVSQNAQTYSMNITSLPENGANVRVYKTTANGSDFFGNPVALTLGSNSITVGAVGFDRAVKFQFSNGSVEFDALSLNGEESNCVIPSPVPPTSMISDCEDFVTGPSAWPYVLVATTVADGAVSQNAQTYSMNITSLPENGANVRVYKTTANGSDFFGNPVALTLGSNSITVGAVDFDRAVKFQFSNGSVEFDALSLNGEESNCVIPSPVPPTSLISDCEDFVTGPSAWPYVLVATTVADGAVSQNAQTYSMNITSLPENGANVRVYKTTANGSDFFGNPVALTLGSNSITVGAVGFDRAVKFQFSNGSVEFDALSLNGEESNCVIPSPVPPTSMISDCEDFVTGPSAWPYVLVATTVADGAVSQNAQTYSMNITSLPENGANVRVYKTTANGSDFFGNPVALTLGSNSITVGAVDFDRAVKFQFSNGSVEFDALSLNGEESNCVNSNIVVISGCTDEGAPNYNPDATEDDGSCEFYCASGVEATLGGGSYISETAYEITACDGTVLYSGGGAEEQTCFDLPEEYIITMTDSWGDGWNGNVLNIDGVEYTVESGSSATVMIGCGIAGCTDELAPNYNADATIDDGSCEFYCAEGLALTMTDSYGDGWNGNVLTINGTEFTISGYEASANACVTEADCYIFGWIDGSYIGETSWELTMADGTVLSGAAGSLPAEYGDCGVLGCTDEGAPNYNPDATEDDGSCEFYCASGVEATLGGGSYIGETAYEITACDGTVLYSGGGAEEQTCFDLPEEYIITMTDSYGDGWNGNVLNIDGVEYTVESGSSATVMIGCGIAGCTDELAPNYNADATIDDGSCEFYCAEGLALTMTDSYGDGWNGNVLTINGAEFTISGYEASANACVTEADCYEFGWIDGSYIGETSWELTMADGTVLSGAAGSLPADYGDCTVPMTVDFTVDMNAVGSFPNADYDNVVINGTWNGWNGWGVVLSDEDGDNVWTGSGEFDPSIGQFEYVVAVSGPADGYSGWGQQWGSGCENTNFIVIFEEGVDTYSANPTIGCDPVEPTVFNVDMSCAGVEFSTVHLTGPLWGWTTDIIMTDEDGDGIYSITMENLTGDIEYKYMVDYWANQEDLVDDMVAGASCAPITDYSGYANRQVAAGSTTADTYGSCSECTDEIPGCTDPAAVNYNEFATVDDGNCNYCELVTVNFSVDAGDDVSADYDNVVINGSFAGPWFGWGVVLSDDDGDGVYTGSTQVEAGVTHEYVHALTGAADGWSGWGVIGYAPEACALNDTTPNYFFSGECGATIDLPTVCFASCGECVEPVPGCTDPTADNYDPSATEDDGSCDYNTNGLLISDCDDFVAGPNANWTHVLVATTVADGAASQAAQTFTMNVTSLPEGGANVRVYKTTANGGDFFGNAIALTLGSNSITVGAVGFDRAVKFQFSSGDVEFDALSLNGVESTCLESSPQQTTSIITDCDDFVAGPNANWTHVLVATTVADGAASQAAQTFTMNVTSLPEGGANVRVYKTTANGGDFFGNAIALTLGSNSITVGAVGFDRAVKFQFSSGDVEFDALSLNGVESTCTGSILDVLGCTDPTADNYDPSATEDDGSCTFCGEFSAVLIAAGDASAAGSADGYIQATGQNGSSNYDLQVTDADGVAQNPFALAAGDYIVTVVDLSNNCSDSFTQTISEPVFAENPCDIVPTGLFVDDIIHERVRFNWDAPSASPHHYMIRYRPVGTSSWTVMSAGPINTNDFNGTSRTRYFMEPGTTYQWNIRARMLNEDLSIDCQSAWSASSEYTTLPACANLENLSVVTEATWVDFYADAPAAEWGVWDSKGKLREVGSNNYRYVTGGADGIDFRKGNFNPSTENEWHTKAWCTGNVDENGNSDPQYHSGWGDFSTFTTEAPCDKMPTNLTSEAGNNAQTAIKMNWDTPESGAPDHYFLELTNETTGQVFQWNNIAGSATSKIKYGQNVGDQFSWRIRGACGPIGTSWATIFSQPVTYTLGGEREAMNIVADLDVYPNPSRDLFNVTFTSEEAQTMNVKVVNMIGEQVYNEELTEFVGQYTKAINMTTQPKGVYFLEITTDNGAVNKKIVLQ